MHNTPQSIRIDFVCCPQLSQDFIAAAGRADWKCGCSFFFTHSEVIPHSQVHLTSLSLLQLLNIFPHVLPQGLQPPGAAPQPSTKQQQQHHHINMHLPDKWSTLSMYSRQILSLPLAVSQPFWFICLSLRITMSQPDAFSFRQITGLT